jgi:GntR family transcriptional regulator/MocR family aminotransferase
MIIVTDQMARAAYRPNWPEGPDDQPLFLQISRQIARDIQARVLRPGSALPGSRELSRSLGVHRNTALAALAELSSQGWIQTEPRRGTFVSEQIPVVEPRRTARRVAAVSRPLDLPEPPGPEPFPAPQPDVLPLLGGLPDYRLVPAAEVARAYRRALARSPRMLGYGSAYGDPRLRSVLAALLRDTRGLAVDADGLVITRGSQMALFLLGRAVVRPGQLVAVEGVGYSPAWESLRLAGAELAPLPVDAQGLSLQALEKLLEQRRLAAIYITPHHQYPTTVTLSASRRLQLLALARRHGFVVIEDDYDHEHHYDGRPVLPLASVDAEVVAYVGTLSKVLAPGLRLGYLAARPEIVERAVRTRSYVDRCGDQVTERAIAELIEDDWLGRHMRRVRREYHARRDALVSELERRLGGALSFRVPRGGMALWAKLCARGVSSDAWAERALERKVAVLPGRRFRFDGREGPFLRLGFAALNEGEIAVAVTRLAATMPRAS